MIKSGLKKQKGDIKSKVNQTMWACVKMIER